MVRALYKTHLPYTPFLPPRVALLCGGLRGLVARLHDQGLLAGVAPAGQDANTCTAWCAAESPDTLRMKFLASQPVSIHRNGPFLASRPVFMHHF